MSLAEKIEYKTLQVIDCTPDLLEKFNRFQKVSRSWRKENDEWVLKDISFTDQWDNEQKAEKIASFIWCIKNGGYVLGAFFENNLVGFASLNCDLFGTDKEYMNLEMLHVSFEYRGKGIGRKLFSDICKKAKQMGAKKLYISAHSSEESQAFYKSAGCVEAAEINMVLAENEPSDCQMEYII